MDYVVRVLAGGIMGSMYVVLGDLLRSKPFFTLFGAAPSTALATLTIIFQRPGFSYVAIKRKSMLIGAPSLPLSWVILLSVAVGLFFTRMTYGKLPYDWSAA
jgi:hypothetical protein